jgi:hypothetical protein
VTQESAWFWLLTVGAVAFWAIAALCCRSCGSRPSPPPAANSLWLVGAFGPLRARRRLADDDHHGHRGCGRQRILGTLGWGRVPSDAPLGRASPPSSPSVSHRSCARRSVPLARRVGALSLARDRRLDPTSRDQMMNFCTNMRNTPRCRPSVLHVLRCAVVPATRPWPSRRAVDRRALDPPPVALDPRRAVDPPPVAVDPPPAGRQRPLTRRRPHG